MDMYLKTPTEGAADEQRYGEVRPSLLLVLPRLIFGVLVALVLSYYLPSIYAAIPFYDVTVPVFWNWLAVWVVCMLPAAWYAIVLMTTQYEITSQRIFYKRGVLNRHRDQLEIVRIRDLATYRPFIQRIVGLGTLHLETVDRSHPTLSIPGLYNVDELKQHLHRLNVHERRRLGYREFESTM